MGRDKQLTPKLCLETDSRLVCCIPAWHQCELLCLPKTHNYPWQQVVRKLGLSFQT